MRREPEARRSIASVCKKRVVGQTELAVAVVESGIVALSIHSLSEIHVRVVLEWQVIGRSN